ncbi:MAG: uncharacterized membrane protein YbaN (DUF454 family) [Pseudohongiellaceae bacterium]|jgi:uncharacterized membrane protein YbaN (DUF454 family)
MTDTPPPPADSETSATGPERSRSSRLLLVGSGSLCLALGAAGVLLPLLPTTPFVLLAAACFSRSSPAFHRALRESRIFGPVLRDWEDHRSIPRGAKVRACSLVLVVFAASMVWAVDGTTPRVILGAIGSGLLIFLARLPVTPESTKRQAAR